MSLQFSRDVKVRVQLGDNVWEIPVLDGYSFNQSTNASEITLNEAGLVSRRARLMFNDSLSPVEWSFQTYARPFLSAGGASPNWGTTSVHAVEEALWALFVGATEFSRTGGSGDQWTGASITPRPITYTAGAAGTRSMNINFASSNLSFYPDNFSIYFVFSADTPQEIGYKVNRAVISTATCDFDIDGITTVSWSGMGSSVEDIGSNAPAVTIKEAVGVTDYNNLTTFIRTRLTDVTVTRNDVSPPATYGLVVTGGSITFENNINYLTPEELGTVNIPLGNVTGTRSVSGNLTAYLDTGSGKTADLLKDLIEDSTTIRNIFDLSIYVGGQSSQPSIRYHLPTAHLEIPNTAVEDILSVDVSFHGQVANGDVNATNEAFIFYKA